MRDCFDDVRFDLSVELDRRRVVQHDCADVIQAMLDWAIDLPPGMYPITCITFQTDDLTEGRENRK